MENKAHALAAGAFVLLAASLLVALAVWLTRDSGAQRVYEIATREAVAGLQPQAAVQFRGVRVGKVIDIGFDPQAPGQVLVRLAVAADTPVTRSTYASLGFQGVTGIAFVQLDDTGASSEPLPADDDRPARLPLRPGLMSQLSEHGARALAQLEEASRRINQLLSPENQRLITGSVGALGQAAASLPPVVRQAGSTLQALRDAGGGLAAGAEEMKRSVEEYGRLAQRLQQSEGLIDQATRGAAALAAAGQALHVETLPRLQRGAEEAAWAARQMGRAAVTLDANPQALLFGPGPGVPGPGEPGFSATGGLR